jgi:hypothetical protein
VSRDILFDRRDMTLSQLLQEDTKLHLGESFTPEAINALAASSGLPAAKLADFVTADTHALTAWECGQLSIIIWPED